MLKGMSKHFYERFGIGSLDLSFPSNAVMMYGMFPNVKEIVWNHERFRVVRLKIFIKKCQTIVKDTPAILLRAPNAIRTFTQPMPTLNAHNETMLQAIQYI